MIRKLRRRHKIVWLVLALLLPLILIAGIAFRHQEPFNDSIPQRIIGRSSSAN